MKKGVRSERLHPDAEFREAIQACNVSMSFVKGIHHHISEALSRSPVGGPEAIERNLRRCRGHALYVYNRVVSCVTGGYNSRL